MTRRFLATARRLLVRSPQLVPRLGVGLAAVAVSLNAVLSVSNWAAALVVAGVALVLAAGWPVGDEREFAWQELCFLGAGSLLAGAYALSWYWQRVPYDFWLDFPQQSLLYENGLPASHPFFVDVPLGGQYGRNLVVAALARATGLPVLTAGMMSNVAFQVLTVWQSYLVFSKESPRAGMLTTSLLFLGLGVGGWSGLLDHFFHHASLAHLLLLVSWYWLERRSARAIWCLLALGLVFPLYVCLLVPVWLWGAKLDRKVATGLLILVVLLPLQGGPLRQLVSRKTSLAPEQASQQQQFSVRFPKQQFLRIHLQPWAYWRVSLGLTSIPQLGFNNDNRPRFYASVFSWSVLCLHWFPLWLAPLTFYLGEREDRRWWCLGLLAYLTPALVDFGPVYEGEYYRWELAAGLGFGACLGRVLARYRWGWVLVLICCWPGFYRLGHIDWKLDWPSPARWCARHQSQLRLRPGEFELCSELRRLSAAGDLVWRDTMPDQEDDDSMEGDAAVVGLSGRKMTGRAFPLIGDFVGRPPFRPTLNAHAFWVLKDPAAVAETGVTWLLTNRSADFSNCAQKVSEQGEASLWKVSVADPQTPSVGPIGSPPDQLRVYPNTVKLLDSWCPDFEGVLRLRWKRTDPNLSWSSDWIYQSRRDGLILSAPVYPGNYLLELSSGQSISVQVLPLTDLTRLRLVECRSLGNDTVKIVLHNDNEVSLRLSNVRFSLMPRSADGVYQNPVATHLLPAMVVEAGGNLTFQMKGSVPDQGGLNLEARETARMMPLDNLRRSQ
ncbi:MAG: hypothetical protein AB7S38_11980 [Vulcanimicrobiota bacterium]